MRGREELSPLPYPSSPPDCLPAFPLNNHPMATFEIAVGPSVAENLRLCQTSGTDKRPVEDPATTLRPGSITHDRKHGKMPSKWKDEDDFCTWLEAKELDKGIELIVSHVRHSDSPIWRERHLHPWSRTGRSHPRKRAVGAAFAQILSTYRDYSRELQEQARSSAQG